MGEPQVLDITVHAPDRLEHDVLIVDTIHDTGDTIWKAIEFCKSARSIAFCFLFVRGHEVPILPGPVFVGHQLGDNKDYLVGYGMDANGKQRGRSDIVLTKPSDKVPESGFVK